VYVFVFVRTKQWFEVDGRWDLSSQPVRRSLFGQCAVIATNLVRARLGSFEDDDDVTWYDASWTETIRPDIVSCQRVLCV
jgi:hypothetical protein